MLMVDAYIGLGSNLQQPAQQVTSALQALTTIPVSTLVSASSLYRSDPMGPQDQDDYINAVACLRTGLEPLHLLDQLQTIEQTHGRVRKRDRWGPRTLDLDLLMYGFESIDVPRLRVPHYGMAERAFVLLPLQEIAPAEFEIPGLGLLDELVSTLSSSVGCERLAE